MLNKLYDEKKPFSIQKDKSYLNTINDVQVYEKM
jgi:hypothetical protein